MAPERRWRTTAGPGRQWPSPGQRTFNWRLERLTRCTRCNGKKKYRVWHYRSCKCNPPGRLEAGAAPLYPDGHWYEVDPCLGCDGTGRVPIARPPTR